MRISDWSSDVCSSDLMDRPSPTAKVLGSARRKHRPTATQLAWLSRGLAQAGGKLPLFDRYGQRHDIRTIRSCIEQGWAEPWFKIGRASCRERVCQYV